MSPDRVAPGAEPVAFEPDDGYAIVAFESPEELERPDFGAALGLELPPATLGSWLAARLARLTGADPRIFTGALEVEPDGLFVADLLASDPRGRVLAKLQLQATPELVALLGVAASRLHAARAEHALRAWLTEDPGALADVVVEIEGAAGRVLYGRRAGRLVAGIPSSSPG